MTIKKAGAEAGKTLLNDRHDSAHRFDIDQLDALLKAHRGEILDVMTPAMESAMQGHCKPLAEVILNVIGAMVDDTELPPAHSVTWLRSCCTCVAYAKSGPDALTHSTPWCYDLLTEVEPDWCCRDWRARK